MKYKSKLLMTEDDDTVTEEDDDTVSEDEWRCKTSP